MQAINTQNQYYAQNFQGEIIPLDVELPERTLAQVNKLFAQKTEGRPDVLLIGEKWSSLNGKVDKILFHQWATDCAKILTHDLKTLFLEETPENLADMFATLSERAAREVKYSNLRGELMHLEAKIFKANIRTKLERFRGNIVEFRKNEEIVQRLTNRYKTLQGELKNAKLELKQPVKCIGNWEIEKPFSVINGIKK
ncbi:hypothetical protein IJ596_01535 [bacterium]|nr:hypothetical protein [bacterium]